MIHAICSLSEIDPFQFSAEECRDSGHTVNRSLADTRIALAAWIVREKLRRANHVQTTNRIAL